MTAALAGLTPETLGPIPMLLYPLRRGPVPAAGLATPDGQDLFYMFSILRTVAADEKAIAEAITHNRQLNCAAAEMGGRVYAISAI